MRKVLMGIFVVVLILFLGFWGCTELVPVDTWFSERNTAKTIEPLKAADGYTVVEHEVKENEDGTAEVSGILRERLEESEGDDLNEKPFWFKAEYNTLGNWAVLEVQVDGEQVYDRDTDPTPYPPSELTN